MKHGISVTGATGFIGRHLINRLSRQPGFQLRALAFRTPNEQLPEQDNITWIRGDLENPAALENLCTPGGILIHLAHPSGWSLQSHLENTARLAGLVTERRLRRVVHCSTAVVAGTAPEQRVTEMTRASPGNDYEKIKFRLESEWLRLASGKFDLAIARPTAVFGPGSRNLLSLADALTRGNPLINYLRASVYGRRRMNLVCVQNVVSALEFLALQETPCEGAAFLISDDDDPLNNFCDVERILKREFGIHGDRIPAFPLPPILLRTLLRMSGKSCVDPQRIYDGSRLQTAGWRKSCSLEAGLQTFAAWYKSRHGLT